MKSTGWPLMPPLSLTHLKYAAAASEPSVKSMPGIFVVIEPTLIGVPVAFLPAASGPHCDVDAVAPPASLAAPPPPPPDELSLPPQPASASDSAATMASTRTCLERSIPMDLLARVR